MKPNAGQIDRVLRVIVGLALLSLIFILDGNAKWWGLIGLGPLLTGLLGRCPGYSLLGISTCSLNRKDS